MNDDLNETLENKDEMLSEIEEGSELYEHIRITVDPGQQPERIDTYLTNHLSNISRNRVQNAAKAGNIRKAIKECFGLGEKKEAKETDQQSEAQAQD